MARHGEHIPKLCRRCARNYWKVQTRTASGHLDIYCPSCFADYVEHDRFAEGVRVTTDIRGARTRKQTPVPASMLTPEGYRKPVTEAPVQDGPVVLATHPRGYVIKSAAYGVRMDSAHGYVGSAMTVEYAIGSFALAPYNLDPADWTTAA